jgi:hypothetical protein
MNYKLERGDVGFSDYVGKSGIFRFISKAIRYFTKSKWSHVFQISLKDEAQGLFVTEATEYGVGIHTFDKYKTPGKYKYEIWRVMASEDAIESGITRVVSLDGKSYGYLQLIGFICVWLVRKLTGKKVNNPIGGGRVCSELVLAGMQSVFDWWCQKSTDPIVKEVRDKFMAMDRDTTSPEDIYEVFIAYPQCFVQAASNMD